MLHHILTLARVSNLPTVWSNCLAAWLISGAIPSWNMLPLLVGASLLYAGGCTLNDAFDADWDAQHRPERLIPLGLLNRRAVWGIGLAEIAAGLSAVFAGGVANVWAPLALAACILSYDAWHKASPLSVLIMGACRWLLYVTAAASAGGDLKPVMLCGAVMWLYIIVLSLVARGEANRGDSVPRSRDLLWIVPVALIITGGLQHRWQHLRAEDPLIPAGMAVIGFCLLRPRRKNAPAGEWVNRLLAGIPLLDLCLYYTLPRLPLFPPPAWALAFPVAVALSLLFQRWFRAT